jgi:hypothetical protein
MSAKSKQSGLEWIVLDIDEDAWQQYTDAFATGVDARPQHANSYASNCAPSVDACPGRRRLRQLVLTSAGVVLLLAGFVYRLWYTAEQGLDKMKQDVGNVVKLDAATARAAQPQLAEQAAVETIEFLDGKAMAQVIFTRTLPAGHMVVQRQTQFFAQTAQGWVRTEPVTDFWGEPQTLDTPNLHFLFRSRDRAAVEQLAPRAEELYAALHRATGQSLAPSGGRLTINILPEQVPSHALFTNGSVRLPSPVLLNPFLDYTPEYLLAFLVRSTLASQMLDMQLRQTPAKPQWRPLVEGMSVWLLSSDALPLAPRSMRAGYRVPGNAHGRLDLRVLIGCHPCTDPSSTHTPHAHPVVASHEREQRLAASRSLFDFIVATHGLDILPVLVQGFGHHGDWEALAPAVFGISAAELEAAWTAWHPNAVAGS